MASEQLTVTGRTCAAGIEEVGFVLRRDARAVPGVLWRPAGVPTPPVVLLAHGGGGHKRSARHRRLAAWFAETAGIASLAIDGPFHGDRSPAGDRASDYQPRAIREGAEAVHERMRRDWLDTLTAVQDSGWADGQRVAFLGMSMGARYGLAVCAGLDSALRCAVIGKFGLWQSDELHPGLAANHVVIEAAKRIAAPVLQHVQWDDEIFPRPGQLELFDLLASPDKQLRGRPGGHAVTRPDDELAWREHVAAHLCDTWAGLGPGPGNSGRH